MAMPDKVMEERKKLVNKVIEQMKEGKPFFWNAGYTQQLVNAVTNQPYRGGNVMRLAIASMGNNYDDPRWCTFAQAKANGWKVKKGEHGTKIEVWKEYKPKNQDKQEEAETKEKERDRYGEPLKPKRFYQVALPTVFNAAQLEGIPPLPELSPDHKAEVEKQRIEALETIIAHSEAPVIHDQIAANFYMPSDDEVHVMPKEKFDHADSYYSTVIHEIGHSTGHEKRLNRPRGGAFGTKAYAKEELRAEMTSMFLNAEFNTRFDEDHFKNHSAYLQSWVKVLHDDPNELFRAASDADKAVQYIHANMLDKFLAKDKTQEEKAVLALSPLEQMDKEQLDVYGESVKAAREHEMWQTMDKIPLEVSRSYTAIANPEDWSVCRDTAIALWETKGLPLQLDNMKDTLGCVKDPTVHRAMTQITNLAHKLAAHHDQQRIANLKEAYPLRYGDPYVHIRWSERLTTEKTIGPYDWDDGLDLSIAAAEHLFKEYDAQTYLDNKLTGFEHTVSKTAYVIYSDQQEKKELWDGRYDLADCNGGLIKDIQRSDKSFGETLEALKEIQEKRRMMPVTEQDKMPEKTRIDVTQALILASKDYPLVDGKPYVTLHHEFGDNDGSLRGVNKALTFLNEKQQWENKYASFRETYEKNINMAYTIFDGTKTYAKGDYLLGQEHQSFVQAANAEKMVAAEKERPKHNISRTIEIKPKRRKKKVMMRNTSTNTKGMSR